MTRRVLPSLLLGLVATGGCTLGGTEVRVGTLDVELFDSPASATPPFTGELSLTTETMVSADGISWFRLALPPVAPPQQSSVAGAWRDGPSLATAAQILGKVVLQRADTIVRVTNDARVPAGSYRFVRLVVYNGGYAKVSGSVEGTTVANDSVAVDVGANVLVVDREVSPVSIDGSPVVTVRWDLNSESWITADAVAARRSSSTRLRDAITVTVQ